MEILVFDKKSKKLLHTFCNCETKSNINDILTFESPIENNSYIENGEYKITWASNVIDNKQIVLASYMPNTGKKITLKPKDVVSPKILEAFKEMKEIDYCHNKGLANPKEYERQFLYGDVSDYIRDYHNNLTYEEREILARLVIGDYVVQHCLL